MIRTFVTLTLLFTACATGPRRVILDASTAKQPSWVKTTEITWDNGKAVALKSQYTVLGNERVNGCYQLAELDLKQTLVTGISEDIKGIIDNAQQGISEESELILSQSRSTKFEGRLTGLKVRERYFERYEVKDDERIDCFVLAEVSREDYNRMKRQIVNKLAAVDPDLKKAILQKQIKFFEDEKVAQDAAREPAGSE